MKRVKIISFTAAGGDVAARILGGLSPARWAGERASTLATDPCHTEQSLSQWAREAFAHADVLLFVGACGIAVRSIAPHLSGKATDPAVVVVDDQGKFAVSLLSGHLGGANALAREVADLLDATPVITTATDGAGCFCVDLWAQQQGLAILGLPEAKAISAALLAGRPVGFRSAFPVEGDLPRGFVWAEGGETGVCVTTGREAPFDTTLRLVPPVVSLGVGCRKGAPAPAIAAAVDRALKEYGVAPEAVVGVYSIDLKQHEPGLADFCAQRCWPLATFPAQALREVPGGFSQSGFVEETTGVDNVCERSAVLGSGGRLIIGKQARGGVTVAAALAEYTVKFDAGEGA